MDLTPKGILEAVGSATPFHQEAVAKSYEGNKVNGWEVELSSIYKGITEGELRVSGSPVDGTFAVIIFSVPNGKYPQLQIMSKGTKFFYFRDYP